MRREVDISPEHLLEYNDNQYVKVTNVEEDERTAKSGAGAIAFLTCALLATFIICATVAHNNNNFNINKNNTNIETLADNNKSNSSNEVKKDSAITFEDESKDTKEEVTEEENVQEIEEKDYTIDYSNVASFYNHITENRAKYGKFAESFQTEEDIKNFINFLYKFDTLYDNVDTATTITSQEMYDQIIQDYYKSCVSHDVKGELNLLYSNNELAQKKVAEAETLAYDLKNGKGNDYTIANNYYTWFLVNLIDERTMVDRTTNNAPFIDALREQFEQYRYSGNMLNARKYQKNDSLDVDSINIYYADEAPEDVEVVEIQNSLTCPDWGVDNVISKYEEDEEVRLYIKKDGQGSFDKIDEKFNLVLNKGKVR